MAAADHEAEVLLQIPSANIDEITRPANAPPNVGTRRTAVQGSELLVLSMTFTVEQLEQARKELNVAPELLTTRPGDPVVVLLCAEYRVPILPTIPVRRGGPLNYVVYVPNITLGINLAANTAPEVLEAFEFIVKTYGHLEPGAIPELQGQPHLEQPMAARATFEQPAAAAVAQVPVAPLGGFAQQPAPAAQAASAGYYQPYPNRPPPTGMYASPQPSHRSLEEQQQAAADAARGQTEYVVPRRYPGTATMIIQTVPDLPPVSTSTQIAHGITQIAMKATRMITGGTDLAARGISAGSDHIVQNTAACETPVEVPTAALGALRTSRVATKGAVAVSGGFATAVLGITSVVSGQLAGRLRGHVPQNSEPSALDGVKEVGVATVGAAVAIADAALEGARHMLTASCDGVTKVVTHKLGDQAGQATSDGLGLAQDAFATASNVRTAGLKSVAAATLKGTAEKTFA